MRRPTPNILPPLYPAELEAARRTLGERWDLGRPVSVMEMASMLGIAQKDSYLKMESDPSKVTGPVSTAVRAFLRGYRPPNAPATDPAVKSARYRQMRELLGLPPV